MEIVEIIKSKVSDFIDTTDNFLKELKMEINNWNQVHRPSKEEVYSRWYG